MVLASTYISTLKVIGPSGNLSADLGKIMSFNKTERVYVDTKDIKYVTDFLYSAYFTIFHLIFGSKETFNSVKRL